MARSDSLRIEEMLLAELEPRAKELFFKARGLKCGCPILRFLNQRGSLLMTVDDIAYNLGICKSLVEHDLQALVKLGLVSRVSVVGVVFFGLTEDPGMRRAVRDLCSWQDRWHQRLSEIESVVNGQGTLA
jgi:DNA-binding HxlR family transcriptional regulator